MQYMRESFYTFLATLLLALPVSSMASKFIGIRVIDKDYLMLQFRDGEVHYRDNGTGESAFLGHTFVEGDDTLLVFGERLKTAEAQRTGAWLISSPDDKTFAKAQPLAVWRKSKPMNTDHTLTSELDHWLFLRLPRSMRQGCTYEVSIPSDIGVETGRASVCFEGCSRQYHRLFTR